MPLGQLFQGVQHMGNALHRPPAGAEIQVRRRQTAQQGHADVGRRGPPGRTQAGLLLHIVRGKPVVLRPEPVGKILPDQGPLVEQEGPVGGRSPLGPVQRAAHGPGKEGGQDPDEPHRRPRRNPGEEHRHHACRHSGPLFPIVDAVPCPLLRIRRRHPGQQIFSGDKLPPQGRTDG